ERLITATCEKQEIPAGQLTIHADRGTAMTAKSVALLLADLGVTRTHSRPHVSDCQRAFNNPHLWSLNFPHPPHPGGYRHERHIVGRHDAGRRRHWPRGHTTRGGTDGPRGLLAGGPPAVPR